MKTIENVNSKDSKKPCRTSQNAINLVHNQYLIIGQTNASSKLSTRWNKFRLQLQHFRLVKSFCLGILGKCTQIFFQLPTANYKRRGLRNSSKRKPTYSWTKTNYLSLRNNSSESILSRDPYEPNRLWRERRRQNIVKHSPIVDMNVVLKASSENLNNIHVFPTPESPISRSLKR